MKYYRISEPALKELLEAAFTFYALQGGGVDNWQWYSDSIHDYISESSAIDFVNYDSMEEVAASALENYKICHCAEEEQNTTLLETVLDCLNIT